MCFGGLEVLEVGRYNSSINILPYDYANSPYSPLNPRMMLPHVNRGYFLSVYLILDKNALQVSHHF